MKPMCAMPECHREGRYFQKYQDENLNVRGLVCATHDSWLGRRNLLKTVSKDDAIEIDMQIRHEDRAPS